MNLRLVLFALSGLQRACFSAHLSTPISIHLFFYCLYFQSIIVSFLYSLNLPNYFISSMDSPYSPWHFISLTRSKQFISFSANTDINSKSINIILWKVSASLMIRQIFQFSLFFSVIYQLIPVGMCETADWGGVILGQSIDCPSCRGQTFSHNSIVLVTGSSGGAEKLHPQYKPSPARNDK